MNMRRLEGPEGPECLNRNFVALNASRAIALARAMQPSRLSRLQIFTALHLLYRRTDNPTA